MKQLPKKSAGILAYKFDLGLPRVLLVHPGGPFWENRDHGAWSIPKGEHDQEEGAEDAARREFEEETGRAVAEPLFGLGEVRQKSGKIIVAYAAAIDFDAVRLQSNVFELEWPPHSGRIEQFPEVDRAEWFTLAEARDKISVGQLPLLDRLEELLTSSAGP
jgi:predicted NUDIX family NTP pyrophosphohydrolase